MPGREEAYARNGMDEFLQTVHRQMRKVTMFHILDLRQQLRGSFSPSAALAIGLLDERRGLGRRHRDRDRPCHAHQRHVAVDHVGSLGAVREYRRL
jgi:hypothetical protein